MPEKNRMGADPHAESPVYESGASPARARAGMIMIHGRGAEALPFLKLSDEFAQPDVRYLAPQAAGRVWYPLPFTEPIEQHEPHLGSALKKISGLVDQLESEGIPKSKIVLLGFSQGACLALHFSATNSSRFGGIVSLSGGLIGDLIRPAGYSGDLRQTPVFLGVGENDPYVTSGRFTDTASVMEHLNANVTTLISPGSGHTIREAEIKHVRAMLAAILYNEPDKPD
jgi:phospholipase/carboxylesterase